VFSVDINLVICLAAAWLIELTLGSPAFLPKPPSPGARFVTVSADRFLALTERLAGRGGADARGGAKTAGRCAGVFLTVYVLSFTFIIVAVLLDYARKLHPVFYYLLNTFIMCGVINTRKAADAAAPDKKGNGRPSVWRIVMDLSGNYLNGVISPLLYMTAGMFLGLPAVFAAVYKMLSIMYGALVRGDGNYKDLSWAVSGLDNIVNFIPARICGVFLPLISPLCGAGIKGAQHGFRATRDAHSAREYAGLTDRPNDVWPGAAFAGILGIGETIDTGGNGGLTNSRTGKYIVREPAAGDVKRAVRLMAGASVITIAVLCGALLYFAAPF